jgi:hypothetical protein
LETTYASKQSGKETKAEYSGRKQSRTEETQYLDLFDEWRI